jgi:LPS export ABC transporter protein LptC
MDIRVTESKNGLIQYSLTSPKLDHYLGKEPYLEFPQGFHIVFFDSSGAINSEITANYGINYEKKEIMEAHSDVVVINREKDEKLNTEQLTWDQKKHLIYTDKFVKITTKDKVIYGENGLESDEKFENWTLRKVRGDIMLDKDEI